MSFSLSYPIWYILLCLAGAGSLSFLVYKGTAALFEDRRKRILLPILRFVSAFILFFLLLSPVLKWIRNKEEKPVVAFIQDNSASLRSWFGTHDSTSYRKAVEDMLEELRSDYEVKVYQTGNTPSGKLSFSYSDQSTDLSSVMEAVMSENENQNLGAVVLASDGIYNKGVSPLHTEWPFQGTMYAVALGDTTLQKDVQVSRVYHNRMVYLGDQFSLRTDMAAFAANGNDIECKIYHHNTRQTIASKHFMINQNRWAKSDETILNATQAGIQHYTISVSVLNGERNVANNTRDVYVEVTDSKQKVLILAAAPHPDLFALKEALSQNKNYTVQVQLADKPVNDAGSYNLIIFHNLPSSKYSLNGLFEQIKRSGISVWYIVGAQTALPAFNQLQNALEITARSQTMNEVQGLLNPSFSYFTMNPAVSFGALAPLSAPLGDFKAGPNTQVLMQQKVGSLTTLFPLWILQQNSNGRVGVLAGEGVWRWRLYDYQKNANHKMVDDYLSKCVQFLSVKHDQSPFRIATSKKVFSEGEPVSFDAELYNDNYELVNTPDVFLEVKDSSGHVLKYNLNKGINTYSLNMGTMASGSYSYTARTQFNSKNFSGSGAFLVSSQNYEEMNTTADYGLLNQLAKEHQGELIYPSTLKELAEKIRKNPQIHTIIRSQADTDPLINRKWLFFILLVSLALEWFIRKRSGTQ